MLHYKDMTFCKYNNCIHWNSCHRALTEQVKADAKAWWGNDNYPIAVFGTKPSCHSVANQVNEVGL